MPKSDDTRAFEGARASLRTPIVLVVLAANLVTFGVLLLVVQSALERDRQAIASDYIAQLASQLGDVVDGLGRIRAQPLLDWRGWRWFEDVVVAQVPSRGIDGRLTVEGTHLNPLGASHRALGFDEQAALALIVRAVEVDSLVGDARSGAAVPIGRPGAAPWGGAWIRTRPITVRTSPVVTVLPYFLGTLLVTTLGVLTLMRRKVIEPVASLADAVRALEAGDLSARVALPRDRRDEIGVLGRGFNDMAERVERYHRGLESAVEEATQRARSAEVAAMTQRRLAATGELAAGIAHELNNPLGGLMNAVEALRRPDLDPARRAEYLALVGGGLGRMQETVGRLLRLSPRTARTERTSLARPLGDAIGLVRHRAEQEGVAVVLEGPADAPARDAFGSGALEPLAVLPPVLGAANDLGQAFLNLFVNALDAIEEARAGGLAHGGARTIHVSVGREASGELVVRVVDDGPGVADEHVNRVADAFFTTKGQGRGNGLGLAIVHNVVAAHGGRVLLDGRPGLGFAVTVLLPPAGADAEVSP